MVPSHIGSSIDTSFQRSRSSRNCRAGEGPVCRVSVTAHKMPRDITVTLATVDCPSPLISNRPLSERAGVRMRTKRTKSTIRFRSTRMLWGCPLLVVSCGPDATHDEDRGIARGIIAIGDIAVGVIAIGGLSAGVISIGGLSVGLVTIGGVAFGGIVLGGVAVGGVAFGGVAVGLAAAGGVAVGYYAAGGRAVGTYIINATQRDPQAVEFFRHWLPWISRRT